MRTFNRPRRDSEALESDTQDACAAPANGIAAIVCESQVILPDGKNMSSIERLRRLIRRHIKQCLVLAPQRMYRWWLRRTYSKLGPHHVFDVHVDDIHYKLSFSDYPVTDAIVERVQGRREPETMAIYRAIVRPGHNVVEIGACYGEFTIILANCVGPCGKVLAIEGTPRNYAILCHNLKLNDIVNVDAINVFVAHQPGEVAFHKNARHPYDAIARLRSGKPFAGQLSEQTRVRMVRLTSLLETRRFKPDVVCMDIEGFEIEVFEDMRECRWLDRFRPLILFEVHQEVYAADRGLEVVHDVLRAHGYHWRRIAGNLLCFPC